MQTDTPTYTPDERLSSDEIDALLNRLNPTDQERIDVRAHGACTVEDVAETLNLSAHDIYALLTHLRSERALAKLPPSKAYEKRLVALAALLFVSAGIIYCIRTVGFEDLVFNARYVVSASKKRFRPKKVIFPVKKQFDLGLQNPPAGFPISFNSAKVSANVPDRQWTPIGREKAVEQLTTALKVGFQQELDLEKSLPEPPKPISPPPPGLLNGRNFNPGYITYTIANSTGDLAIDPFSATANLSRYQQGLGDFSSLAKSIVDASYEGERIRPAPESSGMYVMPPSGFSIAYRGHVSTSEHAEPLRVLPVDANAYGQRFIESVKSIVRQQDKPLPFIDPAQQSLEAKKAVGVYGTFTVIGPESTWEFSIPTAPSPKYPTAVDVLRGADRIIETNADKVIRMVQKWNRQVSEG